MPTLHSIYSDDLSDRHWEKALAPTEYTILLLMMDGRVTYTLNGQTILLEKGDLLYIPAGTLRRATPIRGYAHRKYSAHFTWTDPDSDAFAPFNPTRYFHTRTTRFDYLKQRFTVLMQQWISKQAYSVPMCQSILQEMLVLACRDVEALNIPSKKSAHVSVLQQYILDHYAEPLRIETLAGLIDRTPNYVTGIFREVTGSPPLDYLHQVRIAAARDLLMNSNMTVGAIAEKLGYCDPSHFNRMFKKHVGLPPSVFAANTHPS